MMRDDKLIDLLRFYTGAEGANRLPDVAYGQKGPVEGIDNIVARRHAVWMALEAIKFVEEAKALDAEFATRNVADMLSRGAFFVALEKGRSKREKAHRWLGFIQGVLWMAGVFSLDELKEHSRKCSDDYVEPKEG